MNSKPLTLRARQLRTVSPLPEVVGKLPRHELYIIVEDVLDTYNVGAIFRVADAVAAKKVYLCGRTLTPPNSKIKHASVNTWQWVPWEHKETAAQAIADVRSSAHDICVIAIEQDEKSVPYDQLTYTLPTALVVGNETRGVSNETRQLVDQIAELTMYGVNASVNVIAALAAVAFHVISKTTRVD